MSRAPSILGSIVRFRRMTGHFLPELRHERMLVAGSTLALLTSVALRLLEPWPLKLVLDHLLDLKPLRLPGIGPLEPSVLIGVVAAGYVVIVAFRSASDYFKKVGFALIGNRVMARIRGRLYRHLQSLSMSFHTKARNGDLLVRVIGDIKLLRDVVVTAMLPLVGSLLMLLGMVSVMFWMNWRLTLLALVIFPLFAFSSVKIGRKIHGAAREQRKREGAMAATAAEAIASVQLVQTLSLEDHFDASFSSQNKKSLTEGVTTRRLAARLERTSEILIAFSTALVLWYGARLALAGALKPTDLIVFLAYLRRGFRPLQDLAKYAGRLAKATAAGERVAELLETVPEIQDAPDAREAAPFAGAVRFSGVHFGYAPPVTVLDGLDFSVEPGQTVALVGHSGIGKSTVLNLLLRLYDPTAGSITIDGHDLRQLTISSLRGQMSVVMQDTILFAATVAENIAFGANQVSAEEIEAAARLAGAHSFIRAMPQGYQAMLGERGVNLSHGQRQRIAIARAAVRNAPLLLLDEPTTGLDEENEQIVRQALLRLAVGRTTFLVTHQLRDAASADLILYLENGRILERGSYAELRAARGKYAALYEQQNNHASHHREVPSHATTR